MGIHAVIQPRERDEIRALPYVTATIRSKNRLRELKENASCKPVVHDVPEEWIKYLCIALVLFPTLFR